MKKIFLFILICSSFSIYTSAQTDFYHYFYRSKENPFEHLSKPHRHTADSIYCRTHNNIHLKGESLIHYRYNTNNLSDTLSYNNSFKSYRVWNYNEKGLLESYKINNKLVELYKYDEEGRLIERIFDDGSRTEYYYDKENAISIDFTYSEIQEKWIPIVKSVFKYTDYGYDVKDYYFDDDFNEYDALHVVLKYSFNSKGRLVKIDHVFSNNSFPGVIYEYSEKEFTRITYSGDRLYSKEICSYNEYGDIVRYAFYDHYNENSGKWNLLQIKDYTYYYPQTTSNVVINIPNVEISSNNNELNIKAITPSMFYIYDIHGKMTNKIWVNDIASITIRSGIYIVKNGNFSKKILIK